MDHHHQRPQFSGIFFVLLIVVLLWAHGEPQQRARRMHRRGHSVPRHCRPLHVSPTTARRYCLRMNPAALIAAPLAACNVHPASDSPRRPVDHGCRPDGEELSSLLEDCTGAPWKPTRRTVSPSSTSWTPPASVMACHGTTWLMPVSTLPPGLTRPYVTNNPRRPPAAGPPRLPGPLALTA